ncbi:MAG: cupin domain-containing protein [Woeseiaceae bacterium]|nr:cupin domain-containing protein [Woeseiaceae bacterium]
MLKLPGNLGAEQFLERHWQKQPLLMPQAAAPLKPSVSRNELAWLATLDDVESRIVFTDRTGNGVRYRAETGPFDAAFLAGLPARDWTLLVHDVEKHLPALRRIFRLVPFIPDWRVDDLMVSFAVPGGGVGPHRDHYDVFLCQGIGIREWRITSEAVDQNPGASNELSLTREFRGELRHACRNGDVLYLPPGVAHWGTAQRACLTYSIGMRAPQYSDLVGETASAGRSNPFYSDPDLAADESRPGYISGAAVDRALRTLDLPNSCRAQVSEALGRFATQTKPWITPDTPCNDEQARITAALARGRTLRIHGMSRIAWNDTTVFVNGTSMPLIDHASRFLIDTCARRRLRLPAGAPGGWLEIAGWMAARGAFEYVK